MTTPAVPHSLHAVKNFGSNAADADRLLKTCFERHPVYDSVLNGDTYLVLGRKGAGKTAIFSKITEDFDPTKSFAAALSYSDYQWAHHALQAEAGAQQQLRFRASWRYLLLLTLASAIVGRSGSAGDMSGAVWEATTALENFLVDSYGSANPSFTTVFAPTRRLDLSGTLGSSHFGKLTVKSVEMSHLPVHFNEVNAAMQAAVFTASDPEVSYYICFDELDLGFNPDDKDYADQLSGLILAARGLFLAARKAGRAIYPVVFLRDDIFARIQFEDKNKADDESVTLHWDYEDAPVTLRSLMESRFREELGTDSKPDVAWGDVFDESELTRGSKPKYTFMLDRTLLRPRDVIKFCNESLAAYKKDPAGAGLIANKHLYEARNAYSKYLLKEFRDEIHKQMPEHETATSILQRIGLTTFSRVEFVAAAKQQKLDEPAAEAMLRSLFDFSIIGVRRVGGPKSGSGWVWKYLDPEATFTANEQQIKVHPGLKEALLLKEPREKLGPGSSIDAEVLVGADDGDED
ncbi:hypothetical protein MHY30_07420 [Microbacterium sp. ACRRU]|uniref:P-loop ATPase, Sll1717 family n=1 Tax=Microbacterium sp. ACRRU TaxID=2918204 RepID=UPI001EF4319A|nr:hypothetical protein [Microbacterium sp. ACRRU]MCG7417328.1 hypothetical protein [Microbacterium sp. ACRRU]